MMRIVKAGWAASVLGLGTAACCVIPITLMLLGVGGSWLAVFNKVAAISVWVISAATLLQIAAWVMVWRNGMTRTRLVQMTTGSVVMVLAWVLFVQGPAVNDFLIAVM